MDSLLEKYLSHNLSIIGTRPANGKLPFISSLIIEALKDKSNKILLLSLDAPDTYYIKYLLNNLTNIDLETINKYMYPCKSISKNRFNHIERDKYIKAIEYLQQSNLIINDYYFINPTNINTSHDIDTICNIIKDNNYEKSIIIIDRIDTLLENDLSLDIILNKLNKLSLALNLNIIIFTNLSREFETTKKLDITSFNNYEIIDKYSNFISVIDNENHQIIKELN